MPQYAEYGMEGRCAIVTGGGTGIGRACAIELAKAGVRVALFGRRTAPLEETAAECDKYTPGALPLSVDVSDPDAVREGVDKVVSAFGRIDILVNDAGIESPYQPGQVPFNDFFDMDEEEYMSFFRVHTLGHYLMMQAVAPVMRERHFGRIVNITSVTALSGAYSSPAYTGSKAAAICQTMAFCRRYGKDNITVNSISPGMVDTPMKTNSPKEEFEMVGKATPLGRVAEPADIARVAMFLAQEHLFVSGQNIVADGGATLML